MTAVVDETFLACMRAALNGPHLRSPGKSVSRPPRKGSQDAENQHTSPTGKSTADRLITLDCPAGQGEASVSRLRLTLDAPLRDRGAYDAADVRRAVPWLKFNHCLFSTSACP